MRRESRNEASEQVRRAGALDRLADRDQRADHDQNRPLDRRVKLGKAEQTEKSDRQRGGNKSDLGRDNSERRRSHRRGQYRDRQHQLPAPPEPQLALGERQTAESRQGVVDRCAAPLEDDRIAELEFEPAEPDRALPPAAANRQDIYAVPFAQMQICG